MKIVISPFSQKMRNGKENPKNYAYWKELIELLKDHEVIQVGVKGEPILTKDVHFNWPLKKIKELISECDLWISVDNFFPHLAQCVNKPGVVLWGRSDPLIFGYKENTNILKDRSLLRPDQFDIWEKIDYNSDIFVKPNEVYEIIVNKKGIYD